VPDEQRREGLRGDEADLDDGLRKDWMNTAEEKNRQENDHPILPLPLNIHMFPPLDSRNALRKPGVSF
jgi:hypothetical protein